MRHFTTALLSVLSLSVFAQRQCATMEILEQQLLQDPARRARLEELERHISQYSPGARSNTIITIPVVFHIVHDGDPVGTSENLSAAQIQAQLEQMNDDFSLTNSDANLIPAMFQPLAANTMIQFCLAERSPDCTTTTGIERHNGGQADWTVAQLNTYLPTVIWDRDEYLNIFTVRFNASENGLLGYAQFPGGSASTDATVVLYSTVGSLAVPNSEGAPYNLGRTMSHEVGHWLNLRHIWGDATCGDDWVSDTPVHETDNSGCPTHPKTNTCSGNPTEMFMNYMDYVDDDCMHLFSAGQSTRMNAVLNGGSRASLVASLSCEAPDFTCLYCDAGTVDIANEKISNVTFAGINQSSSSTAGHENFTMVSGSVTAGSTYSFSASLSNGYSSDQILAWIDFNRDGDFSDAGELMYTSPTGTGPHSTNLTIPSSATSGTTWMRVRLHDTSSGANSTPCGDSDFGQVEDFSVNVSALLPVELLSFEVKLKNASDAWLRWQTASEVNHAGFQVEMAKGDPAAFEQVGYVPAQESHVYEFTVPGLAEGIYYFRLRQLDTDGQSELSPVRSLTVRRQAGFATLFPNPATKELTCNLLHLEETTATASIVNQAGQVLKIKTLESGEATVRFEVGDLQAGVYCLRIQTDGGVENLRFVVQ